MSRSKTNFLKAGGVDHGKELKLRGEKIKKAKNFIFLGSTVGSDGRCEEEVRRTIQAGWMSWKKVCGVQCDRKLSVKVKRKMCKSVDRPAKKKKIKRQRHTFIRKIHLEKSMH